MNLSRHKHWIFDMDGTLTVAAHDFDAIRATLGLAPGRPILEQLAGLPEEQANPLRQRLDEIELEIALKAERQPSARELLAFLYGRDATLGILTRNSRESAIKTLSTCGVAEFFDPGFILDRDACDVKPSPDGIRKLLGLWNAPAVEAVMVGDFLFDLEAGREAGTATVYVDPSGKFEWSQHADVSVRSLSELLDLLRSSG